MQVQEEVGQDDDKDMRMRLYAAHYTIMENANDICRLAIRPTGPSVSSAPTPASPSKVASK